MRLLGSQDIDVPRRLGRILIPVRPRHHLLISAAVRPRRAALIPIDIHLLNRFDIVDLDLRSDKL